jgi:hypothetical protein
LITQLQQKLIAAGLLTSRTAVIAERADFKCEYCGHHIVPRNDDGTDDVDNMACACILCNRIKNRFDPRKVLGSTYTRADALRVAADYIRAQHEATTQHYLAKYRSIIQQARQR